MKKIILPTDFSENAFNTVSYALNLYKEEECAFYLLNIFTHFTYHDELEEFNAGQTDRKDENDSRGNWDSRHLIKHQYDTGN